ncbi:MAG: A/G-specific adenine glycosylase [Elusimicrobia bacterium RIFOXYB2_FULL_49_7]|nr:MAG: A/G-specific adenine glycosylase [Elusimicrobia bacterium RIFOXYB2_FULL_49_7]
MEKTFAGTIISWQIKLGRHHLPWQTHRTPYRVWLSEIMLQQTQVSTVIPYYNRFLKRFPTLSSLAAAKTDTILSLWSGLGYYARARNLHRCARRIMQHHAGRFPNSLEAIQALPGIGRSTAGAIRVFAFCKPSPILDGNVKRVFCRYFGISDDPKHKATEEKLWALSEKLVPIKGIIEYTQGLMDLGATLCTRSSPQCALCPLKKGCQASNLNMTDIWPKSSKRPPLVHRTRFFLVMIQSNKIFLLKRPAKGIWGGLYCLPEIGEAPDAYSYQKMASFQHTFTHFRLTLKPLLIKLNPRQSFPAFQNGNWFSYTKALTLGLPAPIRSFLQTNQTLFSN